MFSPVVSHPLPVVAEAPASPARSQPPLAKAGEPRARSQEVALQALMTAIRQAEPATPTMVRAELDVDKATDRIVARVVSTITGEVVRQYPPEETLHLLARAREQFGRLLKAEI
jgi:uncharacterized FlaG/YvyC family protein